MSPKIKMVKIIIFLVIGLISFQNIRAVDRIKEDTAEFIKLLDSGEIDKVLRLAKELSGNELYHTMALYYFYIGDYKNALNELNKSKNPTLDMQKLSQYLEELNKISKRFTDYEFDHFIVRLSKEDCILQYYLESNLNKIHDTICNVFNYYPDEKTLIEVYPGKEEFAFASTLGDETVERSGAIAICKFNRLMITTPRVLPYGYRWIDTICHEYVHFIINRLTENNCPLWLHEGIARYHDTLWRFNSPVYLAAGNETMLSKAIKENKLISFERMHPSLVYLKNQDEVSLAFAQVSTAIEFMNKKYPDKLQKLLYTMKTKSVDKSFRAVFRLNMKKFESKFIKYLHNLPLKEYSGAVVDKIRWEKKDEIDEFVGIDARDYMRLGDKFRKINNFEVAVLEYKKVLNIEPYNPVVLLRIAKAFFNMNRTKEGIEKLELCIDKNPNYVSGYEVLGKCYLDNGRFDEAIRLFYEAICINPFNPYTHRNLARAYLKSNQPELAQQESHIGHQITKNWYR